MAGRSQTQASAWTPLFDPEPVRSTRVVEQYVFAPSACVTSAFDVTWTSVPSEWAISSGTAGFDGDGMYETGGGFLSVGTPQAWNDYAEATLAVRVSNVTASNVVGLNLEAFAGFLAIYGYDNAEVDSTAVGGENASVSLSTPYSGVIIGRLSSSLGQLNVDVFWDDGSIQHDWNSGSVSPFNGTGDDNTVYVSGGARVGRTAFWPCRKSDTEVATLAASWLA